ncbi:MAG: Aryldialkylphosphatase [Actinomycetia bacterium]|nr:Aryldialkylphosphatase [Actinomycetes bacterium]
MVETALGPIDADRLGRTLMHEHVFIVDMEIRQNYPETWGDDDVKIAAAVTKLNELKSLGIDTVVDLTVLGLGRDIPRVAEVARRTDVNIVVAAGAWTLDVISHYFDHRTARANGGVDPMVNLFVHDILEGIADTGVKAAILRCAVDEEGLTPANERVLRAVAQTHLITGAPITTHTHAASKVGLDQQRVFREEGVDLSRVVIGHSGDTTDLEYLEALMAPGSVLGMDRFGVNALLPFEDRVNTVVELVRRGYASQIVLSHDASCYNHHLPDDIQERSQPDWHYRHIPEAVLPALLERGVTESQIDQMLVGNPRRILAPPASCVP